MVSYSGIHDIAVSSGWNVLEGLDSRGGILRVPWAVRESDSVSLVAEHGGHEARIPHWGCSGPSWLLGGGPQSPLQETGGC